MFFILSEYLSDYWGPFRLLGSHLFMIMVGALLSFAMVLFLLPRLWSRLPTDRGRENTPDPAQAKGKPTGAGIFVYLFSAVAALVVVPWSWQLYGILACLGVCMLLGFLDDRSIIPWGRTLKGLSDLLIAGISALIISGGTPVSMWLPFISGSVTVPIWVYIGFATLLLWLMINATNCSDGIDGLAGSLTLVALGFLAVFLYAVTGHKEVANYLLLPHNPAAAGWATLIFCIAGGLAGYLWHNASPSRVLMGDAGSRFLGLLVGIAVLQAGNPFMAVAVAPVVLLNGGTGLLKILLLKALGRIGFDTTPPHISSTADQHPLVKSLHSVRFPLHDHCRHRLQWSTAQILMRFILIQIIVTPLLFVILIKIR